MRTAFIGAAILTGACASGGPQLSRVADSGFLAVDQGQIYYEVSGAGPALVLVHGGYGDRRMWDNQFHEFAKDFRVVRYDHRGFGRSTAPAAAYSPANDLIRLLDHLRIERAHLVGNSMGGAFALDFALAQPARVDRLVVSASGANGYPYKDEDVEPVRAVFRAAQREGLDRAVELWLQHPMVGVSSRDARVSPLLRTMVSDNRRLFFMEHWPVESLKPSAYERLQEIRRPVLFILGERDTRLVQTTAQQSAARVPGARTRIISGADHLPHMLEPRQFNRMVLQFLKGK